MERKFSGPHSNHGKRRCAKATIMSGQGQEAARLTTKVRLIGGSCQTSGLINVCANGRRLSAAGHRVMSVDSDGAWRRLEYYKMAFHGDITTRRACLRRTHSSPTPVQRAERR